MVQVSSSMATKTDDVTARLLKLEKDAVKSQIMAHVTMVLTVGVLAVLGVTKTK